MTVAELIEQLKQYDPFLPVVMASDEEGNEFSPLAATGDGMYLAETRSSGQVVNREDNYHEDSILVVTLWPTR